MSTLSVVEIVDETVKFYSENVDHRAIICGSCQYTDSSGRHCAVGRCLIDESFVGDADEPGSSSGSINDHWPTEVLLDAALKPQYRGQLLDFWIELQHLHDSRDAWNEHGITDHGRELADKLIRTYA